MVSALDQEQETEGRWPGEHLEHIARHDPARVLAECEAKRRIMTMDFERYGEQVELLYMLALPYAGHPDYEEAWRI